MPVSRPRRRRRDGLSILHGWQAAAAPAILAMALVAITVLLLVAGRHPSPLPLARAVLSGAAWSPDGKHIAVVAAGLGPAGPVVPPVRSRTWL